MSRPTEIYFRVNFTPSGLTFSNPADKAFFIKFCVANSGDFGYIVLNSGPLEKRIGQLKFFHGPLIDAFSRATGNADRLEIKRYLKETCLDRDKPDEVPSLANISMNRMTVFLRRAKDLLMDSGGYLDEYEGREYKFWTEDEPGGRGAEEDNKRVNGEAVPE